MISSGYDIDVVVTEQASARVKDSFGPGKHLVYLGKAKPVEYTTPDIDEPTQQKSEMLVDADEIEFRNRFDEAVPVGAELTLRMGSDGIGTILVWVCE